MAKTLHELGKDLKALLVEGMSSYYGKESFRPERYNNVKLIMDVASDPTPHVTVSLSMSSVQFNIKDGEKMDGGLGMEDRFVKKWIEKPETLPSLRACWELRVNNRGKITDVE